MCAKRLEICLVSYCHTFVEHCMMKIIGLCIYNHHAMLRALRNLYDQLYVSPMVLLSRFIRMSIKRVHNAVAVGPLDWICLPPFTRILLQCMTTTEKNVCHSKGISVSVINSISSECIYFLFITVTSTEGLCTQNWALYAYIWACSAQKFTYYAYQKYLYHSATFLLASEATNHWIKYTGTCDYYTFQKHTHVYYKLSIYKERQIATTAETSYKSYCSLHGLSNQLICLYIAVILIVWH